VATDREGAGVDLDLEEDDASEREWRLGQRGEGGRRREGKERGHQSRAGAGSELKVKDPGGDGDGWRDETGMRCGEGEATGKGGTGNPSRSRPALIYSGRWASGLGSWAPRLPVPPVPARSFGPCPCRTMGQAGGPNTTLGLVLCRPMGHAKSPCCGPCLRPMGWMEIYSCGVIWIQNSKTKSG
jgi:hypothetical protein